MTLKLYEGDRLYKIIEAKTFWDERKRFISKKDMHGKITIYTYIFSEEDLEKNGTVPIEKKRMGLLINDINEDEFKFVLQTNYKLYPNFKILWEKDYSSLSLKDALISIQSDVPIKIILDELNRCTCKNNIR